MPTYRVELDAPRAAQLVGYLRYAYWMGWNIRDASARRNAIDLDIDRAEADRHAKALAWAAWRSSRLCGYETQRPGDVTAEDIARAELAMQDDAITLVLCQLLMASPRGLSKLGEEAERVMREAMEDEEESPD